MNEEPLESWRTYRAIVLDRKGRLQNLGGADGPITIEEAEALLKALAKFLAKAAKKGRSK